MTNESAEPEKRKQGKYQIQMENCRYIERERGEGLVMKEGNVFDHAFIIQ